MSKIHFVFHYEWQEDIRTENTVRGYTEREPEMAKKVVVSGSYRKVK